ncbi:MAG TPA: hypothetical protein VFL80_04405, partial [Thermoanaerobaculia bacterium]|nr:hypothetical protein [Thermoanaerobaculia bacterium]
RVVVELGVNDSTLDLAVGNDGRSFPFQGRFNLDQLLEMEAAPKTLTRRVASLGGQLTIESDSSGSRLAIQLPLESTS